jgi:uncharacterized Zn finger protein
MSTPCPRCGETKTDPVWHGVIYRLVYAFGYRLHRCARCRAPRFIPRHHGKSRDSSQLGNGPASARALAGEIGALGTGEAGPGPEKEHLTAADFPDRDRRRCPACGSTEYHRTKRTGLERLSLRPPMARCENCGMRFVYPGRREKYPEALKSAGAAATLPLFPEEKKTQDMTQENAQPRVSKQVAAADSSDRDSKRCPACGSTEYHRTRRTKLEHFRRRPPMARCKKCGTRFPHPGRREKYPEPLKYVGPAAKASGPAEEQKAPRMAEESPRPKVTQPVTVVDYTEHGRRCCPVCGSSKYHRSRRTTLDRLLLRSAMAHCEKCGSRFPYPKPHHEHSDSVKSGEAAANASHVGEEGRASRTAADSSSRGLNRCPFCGSTAYRRSRRTTLEHLLFRPKMARCRHCRKRFPYPKR